LKVFIINISISVSTTVLCNVLSMDPGIATILSKTMYFILFKHILVTLYNKVSFVNVVN